MRRFLASAWFPVIACLTLLLGTLGATLWLPPMPGNEAISAGGPEMEKVVTIGTWVLGPVAALVSFCIIAVFNGIRRLLRVRQVGLLHPIVIVVGLGPWLAAGWQLVMVEPRFTPAALVIIDVFGRPLLVGSLLAAALTLILSLGLLLPTKR